jgi:predicted nucleic acid-binding protein
MANLLWDASALVKVYVPETGSATAVALFNAVPKAQMATTFPGYAEAHAVLVRKRNQGVLTNSSYQVSVSALEIDVIDDDDFVVLDVPSSAILAGINLIQQHNLNASDAAILATYLLYARILGSPCLLIASDQRFLRAASAEGLTTLDPETVSPNDAIALLARL